MIKVTIGDMKKTKDVFSIVELREILSMRYDNEANSFEIVHIGDSFPHLTILIKQKFATLRYLESFDKPGFVPDNPDNNLDQDGFTTLYYGSPNSAEDVWNRQIVSDSEAIMATEEFAVTAMLPTVIKCVEL
jgi:hypothetical protein